MSLFMLARRIARGTARGTLNCVEYSSIPNKRPGVAYFFFEKNPGGTLLLRWGRLFIFHTNYRGVDYLGGVADILGLLRHIF